MSANTMLKAALAYQAAGLSIIPVAGNKKPLCAWKPFQKKPATVQQIRDWFDRQPHLNLGIVCGQVSGGLLVLDFDHDARTTYLNWKEAVGPLAEKLPAVKTGKGVHIYIRAAEPGGNRKLATSADGRVLIETRGEGGYVIAPPSHHNSGRQYRWLQGDYDIPQISVRALNTVLDAAVALDKRTASTNIPVEHDGSLNNKTGNGKQRLQHYALAVLAREASGLAATPTGSRNHRLNQAAFKTGRYAGAGLLAPLLVEQMLAAACGAGGNGLIADDGLSTFRSTLQSGLEAGLARAVDRDALLARLLERSRNG